MRLWIDRVENYAQPDVWLQVKTPNLDAATRFLVNAGVPIRDELEPLGGFPGHWISDPAGNVLLVSQTGVEVPVVAAEPR